MHLTMEKFANGAVEIADRLVEKLQNMIQARQNIANPISNATAYDETKF